MLRLPLAALAFPVLRLRPRPQLDAFMDTMHALVHADGQVSLFEYCLGRLLTVQVRESLDPSRYARFGRRKPASVRSEFATMLAVVAQAGHARSCLGLAPTLPAAAARATARPLLRMRHRPRRSALDRWEPLDALDPLAKQAMVEAVTAARQPDQTWRGQLWPWPWARTICGALHCPLPPMLEQGMIPGGASSLPPLRSRESQCFVGSD
jgi:hypothetical protein